MRITNRKLRKEFAQPGFCELCGKYCRKREGHHLRTRTPEITIRINMFSCGSTPYWCCPCHTDIGNGIIPASRVLSIVAVREHTTPALITEVMDLFRRLVRPTENQLQAGLDELTPLARLLAVRELDEAPGRRGKRLVLTSRPPTGQ